MDSALQRYEILMNIEQGTRNREHRSKTASLISGQSWVDAALVPGVKDSSFSQNSYYTLHFPLPTHLIGFVRYVFV